LERAEAEEYTQSLAQIWSGSWRQVLWADKNGIPQALGLTTDEWVTSRLGGYIRLGVSERREAARELTASPDDGGHGLSQRQAAAVLGVSQGTVWSDLADQNLSEASEEPQVSEVLEPSADQNYSSAGAEPQASEELEELADADASPADAELDGVPGVNYPRFAEAEEPAAEVEPAETAEERDARKLRKLKEAAKAAALREREAALHRDQDRIQVYLHARAIVISIARQVVEEPDSDYVSDLLAGLSVDEQAAFVKMAPELFNGSA
jgi:hypothetical protein